MKAVMSGTVPMHHKPTVTKRGISLKPSNGSPAFGPVVVTYKESK